MSSIRRASAKDLPAIYYIDDCARVRPERRQLITEAAASGNCYIALKGDSVLGYGILDHTFYDNAFIRLLYVAAGERRTGIGSELLAHMESDCMTEKLFTSTNVSNERMQSLLAKTGYVLSGMILNLDDGDPELVYFKRLR
jgi:ribosomal protein S18 acetylase RimI-like enzyme